MKKLILFVATIFLLNASDAVGQCNSENLSSQCIPKLAAGFNFLKSYKIDGDGGNKDKVEYSYVFLKGTSYMINICAPSQPTDGIVVSLFDSNRNKVISSKLNDQFISAIQYPCNATGVYYIQYTFEKPSSYCGGSALGFKR
ncbi:MAG: hypothetical protein JNK18_02480 [Cyclobacteriaceae bacterium]|nr:hypothetical protein [Cyclobacteriaceae bacterium]